MIDAARIVEDVECRGSGWWGEDVRGSTGARGFNIYSYR